MKTRKEVIKIAGYIILVISCLLFLLIPVIPWLGLSGAKIAGLTAILLITAEISFYLSLFILGRSFYEKIKRKLLFWKPKAGPDVPDGKV